MMKPHRKQRLILILVVVFGLSLAALLISFAFKADINFFFTPAETQDNTAPTNTTIRVGGMVKKGSINKDAGAHKNELVVSFVLEDYDGEVTVTYEGVLPDLFKENTTAIAIGKLGEDKIMRADEVLAKHDENYIPKEVMDNLEMQGHMKAEGKL